MSPSYIHMAAFHPTSKYKLYLYREVGWDGDATVRPSLSRKLAAGHLWCRADFFLLQQPDGRPVLYVPGNAGSMMQARSIASSASRQYWKAPFMKDEVLDALGVQPLDVFTGSLSPPVCLLCDVDGCHID